MTLVVDASVALKWYLIDDGAEAARQILADGDTLAAPELVVAEVCNACWLACRRGEISAAQQGSELVAGRRRGAAQHVAQLLSSDTPRALARRLWVSITSSSRLRTMTWPIDRSRH